MHSTALNFDHPLSVPYLGLQRVKKKIDFFLCFSFLRIGFSFFPEVFLVDQMEPRFGFHVYFFFLLLASIFLSAESQCSETCSRALASYYVWQGSNLTYISQIMKSSLLSTPDDIVSYNKDTVPNKDSVQAFIRVNVPFPCGCINGEFLGYTFQYDVNSGDTYEIVAKKNYANLTTVEWLQKFNSYQPNNIPDTGTLNVTVNCSCGNSDVSKDYGLFITYPLRPGQTLQSVANEVGLDTGLLQRYNPTVNFNQGSGLVYIPGKGTNGFCFDLSLSRYFMA